MTLSYVAVIGDFTSARIQREAKKANPKQTLVQEVGDAQCVQLGLSDCKRYMNLTVPGYLAQWKAPELLSGGQPDLPADIWSLVWIGCEVSGVSCASQSGSILTLSIRGALDPNEWTQI